MILSKGKLAYPKNKVHLLVCLIVIFLFFSYTGKTQSFKFEFDNTPVSEALLQVKLKANIRIAFDAGSLEKFMVSKTIESEKIEEILASVLEGTDYITGYKYETWLIVKASPNSQRNRKAKKQISGIIYDKATGERLPYASVYIWDNNQSLPATVDGTFSAKVNNIEQSYFQVKYLGYQTFDTIIDITRMEEILMIGLQQKSKHIHAINVEGNNLEMLRISDEAGHFTFNPRRFTDLPNYGETDVFRSLQLLPGISAQENSSQLNIRGSSADQNLVIFDGFTLYNLDHFFGVFSAINPNVIKDIQVYRGGFDARYGEKVSGIIDITGKSGNQSKTEVYGGINLISGNLTAEIPVSKKLTLVTAARRSYSDVYSSWLTDAILTNKIAQGRSQEGVDNVIDPIFYFGDFNTKLTWNLNENENISFSLYGAKDDLNSSSMSESNNITADTEDTNDWGNYGVGVSWKKQYGTKYFTKFQFGHSGYYNNYYNHTTFYDEADTIVSLVEETRSNNEENDLVDYFISSQNTYFLNPTNRLEFGLAAKYMAYKFYKETDDNYILNNLYSSAILYAVYFQDQINLTKNIVLKPGFRLNYYDETKKIYFEPRLAANYKLSSRFLLKMAAGNYYQFLSKPESDETYGYNRDFWVLADDTDKSVVSSSHFIIGTSFETRHLFFDMEAYYKIINGLQEYLIYSEGDDTSVKGNFISGEGLACGIDFMLKYSNNNFTSWLAYSISRSTQSFKEINNGDNIPATYDQTHELKWTNIYSYKNWNFSTLTIYNTGHPYISTSTKYSENSISRKYERLPDYFRVDLSVNYNFNINKVNIKPGFSVLNALNTDNYLDAYVRRFNLQRRTFDETILVQAQDLTFNFFVNFSF